MITLEQIRLLEKKISKTVEIINILTEENKTLKKTLESSQDKMKGLEDMVNNFKDNQDEIEKGILGAIEKLDCLEDDIAEQKKNIPQKEEKAEKPKNNIEEPKDNAEKPEEEKVKKEEEKTVLLEEEDDENELDIF